MKVRVRLLKLDERVVVTWTCESRLSAAPSVAKHLLEEARGRGDRLRIGAFLGLVLRGREAVAGAAIDLVLKGDLRDPQFLDHLVDHRQWIAFVLGAVQDQEHALGVLRPSGRVVAERAVDRDIRHELRTGRAELDTDRAAETVADERDL